MKLMIVESPNKIKKIKSYLGEGWNVCASVGHIRDLPVSDMGVSPPYFSPQYIINEDKKKVVSNLKRAVQNASEVYLATDPDREGEAIAHHLRVCLGLNNPKRITFSEITKKAIDAALLNVRSIDDDLVAAQEARRVLDRIVGYSVSPVLSNQAGVPLSAGRVQSPAIKITVLRENQIREFRKRNYYVVEIKLHNGLLATLDVKDWCDDGKHIFDKNIVDAISEFKSVFVSRSEVVEKETRPRPSFTTSTLQQAASTALKFTPANTMRHAQALFEQGAISYHRTDTPNLSNESFLMMCGCLEKLGLDSQETQIKWPIKDSAQEAHEAIRPTDPFNDDAGETSDQKNLYRLIRERALASAMPPAIDVVTELEFKTIDFITIDERVSQAKYTAIGRVEKYKGWRSICTIEKSNLVENTLSAIVREGDRFEGDTAIIEKTTEPPPRFTEATLIKALEKLGIGRPSTYASIMENIKKRGYIVVGDHGKKKSGNQIRPTKTGEMIAQSLSSMTFMNLDYTRILEQKLDEIAAGKSKYIDLVALVYSTIGRECNEIKISSLVETKNCPFCEQPIKRLKSKKRAVGFFWVHAGEHSCREFIDDDNGEPLFESQNVLDCPSCGGKILRKFSKKQAFHFWVHENEDNHGCEKFIKDVDGLPSIKKEDL